MDAVAHQPPSTQTGATAITSETSNNADGERQSGTEKSPNAKGQGGFKALHESIDEPWAVKWDGQDDAADPLNTPKWKKWALTIVLALSAFCVAACSAVAAYTYDGLQADFGISHEVAVLSVSLFVIGFDSGSLLLGPLSELNGRARVLHSSFALFWLLQFPVAFANNSPVHLVFRLLTGLAGSGFLSVSGGAVSDVFRNEDVGTPMMLFSASPFLGGVAPIFAGFINQNASWRWTYYLFIIWAFVLLCLLLVVVPETLNQELLRRKAVKLRRETGESRWFAPVEKTDRSLRAALVTSIKTPFWLLFTQPMILLLDLWSSLILGILYLSFGGIPYIFKTQYNFSLQDTGLVFIGLGVGQCISVASQPYFNRRYMAALKAHGGHPPPEERLKQGFWGALLCPLGLLLMGLLSFKRVPWILPILASSLFGAGMIYSFNSTFTYLVDAYRPVAASALASNTFLRGLFAASFPLFGDQLYERLGSVGGTCLLGGLMCLTAPLPFIFFKIGARIRRNSQCCDPQ